MARRTQGWKLRWRGGVGYARFSHDGARYEESTGESDPRKAAKRAAEIYARIVTGKHHAGRALSPRLPLDELVARWILSISGSEVRANTAKLYELHMRAHIIDFFGTLDRMTRAQIGNYQRERLRVVMRSTLRKERHTIASFMAWGKEQGLVDQDFEMPALPKGGGTRATTRAPEAVALAPAQVEAFLAALPEMSRGKIRQSKRFVVRNRFIVAWETGLRPITIDQLSMPEHFTLGIAELRIADEIDKNRFGRTVAISARARAALEASAAGPGLIFGRHDHRLYVAAAAAEAGLPKGFYPYALKHNAMTAWAEDGDSPMAVAYMVGHKRITTTAGYMRLRKDAADRSVARRDSGANLGQMADGTKNGGPEEPPQDADTVDDVRRTRLELVRCYPLAPQRQAHRESTQEAGGDTPQKTARNRATPDRSGAMPQDESARELIELQAGAVVLAAVSGAHDAMLAGFDLEDA